jgi:hypothetical protein
VVPRAEADVIGWRFPTKASASAAALIVLLSTATGCSDNDAEDFDAAGAGTDLSEAPTPATDGFFQEFADSCSAIIDVLETGGAPELAGLLATTPVFWEFPSGGDTLAAVDAGRSVGFRASADGAIVSIGAVEALSQIMGSGDSRVFRLIGTDADGTPYACFEESISQVSG